MAISNSWPIGTVSAMSNTCIQCSSHTKGVRNKTCQMRLEGLVVDQWKVKHMTRVLSLLAHGHILHLQSSAPNMAVHSVLTRPRELAPEPDCHTITWSQFAPSEVCLRQNSLTKHPPNILCVHATASAQGRHLQGARTPVDPAGPP